MRLRELLQTPPPDVAVEIDRGHVSAARLTWRSGQALVAGHAWEALPPGAVTPSIASTNMPDVSAVAQAVGRVLAQLGGRSPRVALVLPDVVAKVTLLRLDSMPARSADVQEIVRWQVRKAAPFPIEQAVLSVTPGSVSPEGGRELVVAFARADIVQEYEQACQLAGAHAGLVDLATFSVINGLLAPAAPAVSGDWLLVHVTDTGIALAVLRDGSLLFFRNRTDEAEGSMSDLIHQTAMYYEDRLGGRGFARVLLAGGARLPGGAEVVGGLEQRLGIRVEPVDARSAASLVDRIDASPELLDRLGPLVGVLVRERAVA